MDEISLRLAHFAASGLCCSQIIMALALEQQGEQNLPLVRAMAGLCNGQGDCSGDCGVLTGGVCVIAMHGAKGTDGDEEHERLPLMLATFTDWFRNEACASYGGCRCADILGEGNCGAPDKERCGNLVVTAYQQCLQILVDNGIDPSQPRECDCV